MTTNEIITLIGTSLVAPLLAWGLAIAQRWILAKAKNETAKTVLLIASDAIYAAVAETNQIIVDEAKKDGTWSPETAKAAFERSVERAKQILGKAGEEALQRVVGDANTYIEAKIEETVRDTNRGVTACISQ